MDDHAALLGSDLGTHRDEIEAMVCADQSDTSMANSVLRQLLTRIDSVASLSTEVSSVASSVLGCLKKAYTYAHKTTQARVALGDSSMVAVSEFDAAFKKCLKSKLKEEELTREELDRCEQLAEEAVLETREECAKLKKIEKEELLMINLQELEQIESNAKTVLFEEENTLTGDKEQFINEAKGIDKLLAKMKIVSDHCDDQYDKTVKELTEEDYANRCHQEKLDEQMAWLEKELETAAAAEESVEQKQKQIDNQNSVLEQLEVLQTRLREVVATLTLEEYHQRDGNQFYDEIVEKYSRRRDELNSLCDQADMSLQVVEIMNDCVGLVMHDAKEKNATWEQIKLTNLLQLRDTIMTVASLHMMRVEVWSTTGSDQTPDGRSEKGTRQQQYQVLEYVRKLQDELEVTDGEIRMLKPHLHLDTLSERIEMQKRRSRQALEKRVKFAEVEQDIQQHLGDNGRSIGHKDKQRVIKGKSVKRHRTIYLCKFCKKTFIYECRLTQHMLSHTKEKPHSCTKCSRTFSLKGDLTRHMVKKH